MFVLSGGGGSKEEAEVDRGVELECFQARYIGSVPVRSGTGTDVCAVAVERLLALKTPERPVEMLITTNGVYIIDVKTRDCLKSVAITDVSFVAQDPIDSKITSFFENERSLRLITCHTFRVAKEAFRIPVTINESFKILQGKVPMPDSSKIRRASSGSMNKKDALKASMSSSTKLVDKGEKLFTYSVTFRGSVNVSSPRGDDVANEALTRIAQVTEAKPPKCLINVYDKIFELYDPRQGLALQSSSIRDITFVRLNEEKTDLVYIIHDRRLDQMTCSQCDMEPAGAEEPSIRRIIDQAQKKLIAEAKADAERRAAMAIMDGESTAKASAEVDKEVETGRIIGIFEASFMGTVPVNGVKGEDVVNSAIAAVKTKSLEGVFIQVSTEGIRTIEALGHEVLSAFIIKDISFTTVAGKARDVFAFIQKDDGLGVINCHLFKCAGERAFDIATAFGEAFKSFAEEQKKLGGNPFQPFGPRENPPGILFKKQVHRVDLIPRKPIGAGQFGQVFLAKQKVAAGEGQDGTNEWDRAVKMLRGGASDHDRDEFVREAEVMIEMKHENLVEMIGVTMQQKPWLIVLEFLQYGDLRGLVKGLGIKNIVMNYAEQLTFGVKIAAGMEYLHKLRLIHMDLAARNCLVGRGNEVKVADFGLTRKLADNSTSWRSDKVMKLPVKWCSIEALDERIFSEASDVWSFGIVMYGEMPYPQLKTSEVQRKVREGTRPDKPKVCSPELFSVMSACWRVEPGARPTFTNIFRELSTYLRSTKEQVRDLGAQLAAMGK